METTLEPMNPVASLLRERTNLRLLFALSVFCTITIIFIPVALVLVLVYRSKRKRFRRSPLSTGLSSYVKARDVYLEGHLNIEQAAMDWEDRKENLDFQLDCLKKGWGIPFFYTSESVLCELYLDSEIAPRGPIAGATAVFADNTSVQTYSTGSTASTSFNHGSEFSSDHNYNRVESSQTRVTHHVAQRQSGTASVQISGGKIIPGVILFSSATEAQDFTNSFNNAAHSTAAAKKNLAENVEVCKDMIKEHRLEGKGDFGLKELENSINSYPEDVQNWILEAAKTQLDSMRFRRAVRADIPRQVGAVGVLFPTTAEKFVGKLAEVADSLAKRQ